MRQTVREFQRRHFEPGSEPSLRTLKRWRHQGIVQMEKIGGTWYIVRSTLDKPRSQMVQRVLEG